MFVFCLVVTNWSRVPTDHRGDRLCSVSLHTRCHVGVGVQSDVDGRVAEAFLDHLRMNAGLQSQGCPRVAKVVQTNHGQGVPLDTASELPRETLWM